jgi:hypothetical protein
MTDMKLDGHAEAERPGGWFEDSHPAELWTEEAVRMHPKWQQVRGAAKHALVEFGWDEGPPNPKRGYVID